MKKYQNKINWLLPIRKTFHTGECSEIERLKDLRSILKVLGIKSLDRLILRDENLKMLDTYNRQMMFINDKIALGEFMKWLRKELKSDKNQNIVYVELLKG